MKKDSIELLVGIFVLIGIGCMGYMTVKLGELEIFENDQYILTAKFDSIAGLKKWARVEMSGIQVGRVSNMSLDKTDQIAVVELKINNDMQLGDDIIASIKTSGLIGDKYIDLTPGGSEIYLKNGDTITETESSIDLEELIGKYVFGALK